MKMAKRLALSLVIGVTALCAALASVTQLLAATPLAPRTSDGGGVRVVVTPKAAEPGAAVWEFEVVMDTHTKPLDEDIAHAAVLVDDSGRQHPALAWQGDPPGGHHRKGILRFPLPAERSKIIELQISGVGGPGKRVFRWELN
jgi:hypothetical protein